MAITWTNTIKGQFTQFDIDHMKQITGNALKLDDYDSVKTWAGQIWIQVSNGYMPPSNPWTDDQKSNFQSWMNSGMSFGDAVPPPPVTTPPAATVTWTSTIKGQFRQLDIDHMKQVTGGSIDLSNYTSVRTNGSKIYDMVSHKRMPPGNPWNDQYIQSFQTWMNAGYPEN
jgi:hypothetical protein